MHLMCQNSTHKKMGKTVTRYNLLNVPREGVSTATLGTLGTIWLLYLNKGKEGLFWARERLF